MSLPEWMMPYLRRMNEEYTRIGFTEDELLALTGSDEMPDEAGFQRGEVVDALHRVVEDS